jgi:hypothetical protein
MLEDYPLLAVSDCLFSIFVLSSIYGGRLVSQGRRLKWYCLYDYTTNPSFLPFLSDLLN